MVQPSILKCHKRSNMIEPHNNRLYSIMSDSKIIAGPHLKVWHLVFFVIVSVLLPICCHIGSSMPYLCIFVEKVAPVLGTWLMNGCEHLSVVGIRT